MITLGIIGVVASITIPQVIANYTKKVTVNKLKKNYAIIQQAIKRSELDNEPVQSWDSSLNGHEFFERYLKNYFTNTTEISTTELINRVGRRKLLNGQNYVNGLYNVDGDFKVHFLINDGSLISITLATLETETDGYFLGIDVNGFAEPNTVGKDTFLFSYTSKYGLIPLGDKGTHSSWLCNNCTRDELIGNSTNACNKQKSGYWCAYLIINDGWEIRKDYPW